MQEEIDLILGMARQSMGAAIDHLQNELAKVRTGKASANMFDGLYVDYYGSSTALSGVATVKVLDGRTITITPWEKNMIKAIESAIFEANMGVTPQNDGIMVRITLPPMTEERRKELAKTASNMSEHAKVSIRNARREAIEDIKKAVKNGYSEDLGKRAEAQIQAFTDEFTSKADKVLELKQKDIMTI
jgi:ribosome recycling factor